MASTTISTEPPGSSLSISTSPLDDFPQKPLLTRRDSPPFSPLCWGHRGASAAYPENTLASFEAAIRDGAEGIESDVHITHDDEIVMFHDPHLDRTTNGTGRIQTQKYHGGLDQLVTRKSPAQKIPTFRETIDLLMLPENSHVFLNIDVKVDNDPERLFTLMHAIISSHEGYVEKLGPRLVLGLWHPKFIFFAQKILPYIRLAHIGMSPALARKYFWNACGSFSMNFSCLVTNDGELFRKECKDSGKDLYVWTVNKRSEMIEATKWGAKAILTDKTAEFLALRAQMEDNWTTVSAETTWRFNYSSFWYTSLANYILSSWELFLLTKSAGDFSSSTLPPLPASSPVVAAR